MAIQDMTIGELEAGLESINLHGRVIPRIPTDAELAEKGCSVAVYNHFNPLAASLFALESLATSTDGLAASVAKARQIQTTRDGHYLIPVDPDILEHLESIGVSQFKIERLSGCAAAIVLEYDCGLTLVSCRQMYGDQSYPLRITDAYTPWIEVEASGIKRLELTSSDTLRIRSDDSRTTTADGVSQLYETGKLIGKEQPSEIYSSDGLLNIDISESGVVHKSLIPQNIIDKLHRGVQRFKQYGGATGFIEQLTDDNYISEKGRLRAHLSIGACFNPKYADFRNVRLEELVNWHQE